MDSYTNQEAEMALIGIALTNPDKVRLVTDTPDEIWYDQRSRAVHQCLKAMAEAKAAIDLVTADAWLSEHRMLDEVGPSYLAECATSGYLVSNAGKYLQILQRCAMNRAMARLSKELTERTATADDPEQTREWAVRRLKELRMGAESMLIPMKDALATTFERLGEEQRKANEPSRNIMSGIATLDNKLGGLRGGEYIAIGARPSVGKSILALTFCLNAAKQGKRVLLVSMEMSEVEITERVLANVGSIPMQVITSGGIAPEQWERITAAMPPISRLPLWYSLEANTVDKVRRAAYQLYENGGIDMIAIDYLQLMDATNAVRQSRQEQVAEISRGIKRLAMELNIPIIVLTQLNRSSVSGRTATGQRVRREPTMSDARESGSIEQDANVFILLHNPEKDEMQTDKEKSMWDTLNGAGYTTMSVIVEKNRQGKRGKVYVAFDGDHMRFMPVAKKE